MRLIEKLRVGIMKSAKQKAKSETQHAALLFGFLAFTAVGSFVATVSAHQRAVEEFVDGGVVAVDAEQPIARL
jgi:hypothetical protein